MPIRKISSAFRAPSLGVLLMGKEDEFSFEHRVFNLTGAITLMILSAFLVIDVLIAANKSTLLLLGLMVIQIVYYILSRKMRKYRSIIVSYVIVVYTGLSANYFFNAGIDGPTLLLFFTTLQLALNISHREKYLLWLILSLIIPGSLLATELYFPRLITGYYKTPTEKIIDRFGCYVLSTIYIFFATSSFKRHITGQQEREQKGAADIVEYGIRLQAFFESLTDNFVLLDRNMRVLYFNKAAVDLTSTFYGRKIEENLNIDQFVHESNKASFYYCFNTALGGTAIAREFQRVYSTKETWWLSTFNPARNENGEIIGVTLIMKDITDAYLYKLKIERKNELLEKIAFIQAHELRGPLTSVQSLLELIKEEYCDMDLIYTQKLEEGLNRLDDKIKEIITLSSGHKEEL
ncbi:PAS domain-containing protein [Chitinophaga sp. CF418]|uniref:PAS domain-containing protein n=1 Tax=Chitinophaga sp. CF418 TaxID=1855287 RepID=UPI00091F5E01|nr:PAS domain-containing protein [Chitinophaga sp. CF418]SHN39762.1 PAS domain S-box-containing protein [Chitinophaga sp. CF418]